MGNAQAPPARPPQGTTPRQGPKQHSRDNFLTTAMNNDTLTFTDTMGPTEAPHVCPYHGCPMNHSDAMSPDGQPKGDPIDAYRAVPLTASNPHQQNPSAYNYQPQGYAPPAQQTGTQYDPYGQQPQGYNPQSSLGGYGQPAASPYQQQYGADPSSQYYPQPQGSQYVQPQYAQPQTPQYAQPQASQYAQPQASQYAQPQASQYGQPQTPQYAQPPTGQFQPQSVQYQQPQSSLWAQPQNSSAYNQIAPHAQSTAYPQTPSYAAPQTPQYGQSSYGQSPMSASQFAQANGYQQAYNPQQQQQAQPQRTVPWPSASPAVRHPGAPSQVATTAMQPPQQPQQPLAGQPQWNAQQQMPNPVNQKWGPQVPSAVRGVTAGGPSQQRMLPDAAERLDGTESERSSLERWEPSKPPERSHRYRREREPNDCGLRRRKSWNEDQYMKSLRRPRPACCMAVY